MASILQVEAKIERVEGFRVNLLHARDGRNVRSDREGLPSYPYRNALKGNATVKDWKDGRFLREYSGWDVEVLLPNGNPAHGGTKLHTLRSEYDSG